MHSYLSHVVQRIPEISQNRVHMKNNLLIVMQVYIELMMLKSVVTSLCVLSTASMTVLMWCLLTCMAYLMTFSIEMTCTNICCCWICDSISWSIHFLMSFTPLIMAVQVSQMRVSPKKDKRLLLACLHKGDILLKEGSLFSSWVTVSMRSLYDV